MHRLSSVNVGSRTAQCAQCGPTTLRAKGEGEWRCTNSGRQRVTRRNKAGLTPQEADVIIKKQKGLCALCRESKRLFIDHDHGTGEIRGALCHWCNRLIASVDKHPGMLARMVAYYQAH